MASHKGVLETDVIFPELYANTFSDMFDDDNDPDNRDHSDDGKSDVWCKTDMKPSKNVSLDLEVEHDCS
jgi:hypothetical protein